MSWFPIDPYGVLAKGYRGVLLLTEPVMSPLRRVVPPVRVGPVAFDLSAMIIVIVLIVIRQVVC